MTRRGKIVGAGAALLLVLFAALGWRSGGLLSVTESTERSSYYFRLKASYTHDDEPIDFDIVVACSIRIDRYKSGDSGFLGARYPRFFVKETHDGHAVMQIVPIACRGETTAHGRVPGDFLPGVIWFDKPGDYRFGIAYVSEDAFENPNSQLKFRGASIEKATHEDWEKFRDAATSNEGLRRRYYDRPYYWAGDGRRIAAARGSEVEAAYARGCSGVRRYKLSEAGREIVRKYWPENKPLYWATNDRDSGPWPELQELEKSKPIFTSGLRYVEHFVGSSYAYAGFPTRARGGMINSRSYRYFPPEFFPGRNDRAVTQVFTDEVANSQYLTRDIEVRSGMGKGYLYCYTTLNPGKDELEVPIPDFRTRHSRVRVDGDVVETPQPKNWSWPSPFFEQDKYVYFLIGIGSS